MVEYDGQKYSFGKTVDWLIEMTDQLRELVCPLAVRLGWEPSTVIVAGGALLLLIIVAGNMLRRSPVRKFAATVAANEERMKSEMHKLELRVRELENSLVEMGGRTERTEEHVQEITQRLNRVTERQVSMKNMIPADSTAKLR